jgi:hypothetical protein
LFYNLLVNSYNCFKHVYDYIAKIFEEPVRR